eukprot:2609569-Lingulodinium_polyedra.AAC.1
MHPLASGRLPEPLDVVQMDGLDWVHPSTGARARATLLVDEGSAKVVARARAVQADGGPCGHTSAMEAWSTL